MSMSPELIQAPHAPMPLLLPGLLGLPFDVLRLQYANAVRAGLIAPSLLASSRFGQALGALERLAYGPYARSV